MAKPKSIKLNFIMNSLLTMSSVIFPLITFPYVARVLSPIGIGKVNFAISVIAYFSMFAQLGIPTYGIRACARVRDDKSELSRTVLEILIINLITCIITYLTLFAFIMVIPRFSQDKTLFLIVSATIIMNAIGVEWLYRGLEEYVYISVRSIAFKFIALVLMFLLIKNSNDYVIYGGLTIFASVGSNALNFINLRKIVNFKCKELNLKRHLKPVAIFFGMSVATTIYANMDTVMLGFMQTDSDVGLYNAAIKIKNVLISFVTSLGAVLLPRATKYVEDGDLDSFRNITKKANNYVIVVAGSLTVYFMIFAGPAIRLLCGEEFEGAILPMRIIMPTLLLVGLSNISGLQMLVPLGLEKRVLLSEIVGVIVNAIVNILLIPTISSSGAAIGTVCAELAVIIVQLLCLHKVMDLNVIPSKLGIIIVGLITAVVASIWTLFVFSANITIILASSILFFGVYGAVLIIGKEEMVITIIIPFIKSYINKVK